MQLIAAPSIVANRITDASTSKRTNGDHTPSGCGGVAAASTCASSSSTTKAPASRARTGCAAGTGRPASRPRLLVQRRSRDPPPPRPHASARRASAGLDRRKPACRWRRSAPRSSPRPALAAERPRPEQLRGRSPAGRPALPLAPCRPHPACQAAAYWLDDQGSTPKALASSALPGPKNEWIESSR